MASNSKLEWNCLRCGASFTFDCPISDVQSMIGAHQETCHAKLLPFLGLPDGLVTPVEPTEPRPAERPSYDAVRIAKHDWQVWNGFAGRWHMSMGYVLHYSGRKEAESAACALNEPVPHRYDYGNSIRTDCCRLTTHQGGQSGSSYCCGRDAREHLGHGR